ncbi:glycosyltransferase [Niabella ginsengisoli]|uniref:Uncharacterized protein n=1 Tax=Niabella ginsengisoli TaxID=522298 RepID=A0ABS9SQF2_9BACT|nr:hypothetical protein [Niabella ginsengisoli]MCH5600623.1 hypothetical protein [Niabella ginsengisoli]
MNAVTPQIAMNYPEYAAINKRYKIAELIDQLDEHSIAIAINKLLDDESYFQQLQQNCLRARQELNWENERLKLIEFYKKLFITI